MSTNTEIKNILDAFGFVSNEAKRNLVIFIIVILVFSNIFFIYQNIQLMNDLQEEKESKSEIILVLSKQITDEVRKQIIPTTERINQTITKIDSVAMKTNDYLDNVK